MTGDQIVVPSYGRATLGEVLPAIASHLGADDADAADVLGLPDTHRYVLCLVDGLGADLLAAHADVAPHLAAALDRSPQLVAGVPSTTATSLTTLATGVAPGRHGIVGYTFRWAPRRVIAPLSWHGGPRDAAGFQAIPPWWQRLTALGVSVCTVGPAELMGTQLTTAMLRGARYIPVEDETDASLRIAQVAQAARAGSSSLVYAYERGLDRAGHRAGVASQRWRDTLRFVDGLIHGLRTRLDPEVTLVVTGDHGMVDVPTQHRLWCEDEPRLMRDVELVAGEGRFRHVYTDRPHQVAQTWAQQLGERAKVFLGEQAIADGWFGEVAPAMRARIGDVLAVAQGDWALLSHQLPDEAKLVGMHAGMTHAEMVVPLLVFPGQE
ncbi:MAG: alkaline phosphatase family protein [Propionibacteriaceae bacterium]|nr:alkaline phosphatase family protein [Propionibacteriaceae bacterium]